MQIELEKMVQSVSRTGRELQRYSSGRRQVVGCIPYRYVKPEKPSCSSSGLIEELEVLLISSQKSSIMMFPKGGWEYDETMEKAAERECMEEAGVIGTVERILGNWRFESKSQNASRDAFMFPLLVQEELDHWPEKNCRQRRWVKVKEARELCCHLWMKEALDALVERLALVHSLQGTAIDSLTEDSPCYWNLSADCGGKCSARDLEISTRNRKRQIEVPQNC
ncbi:Nudix hydrolase 18, mitochondrial [Dionaea muscipula]